MRDTAPPAAGHGQGTGMRWVRSIRRVPGVQGVPPSGSGQAKTRRRGATVVSLPSGALLYIEGVRRSAVRRSVGFRTDTPRTSPDIDQCLWMAESFYNRPPARSEAPSQKGFTARLSTECRLSTAGDGVPDGVACPATIHRSDDERLSTSQDGHVAPGPCTECLPLPVLVRKSRAISCGTDVSLVISHADSAWGSHYGIRRGRGAHESLRPFACRERLSRWSDSRLPQELRVTKHG